MHSHQFLNTLAILVVSSAQRKRQPETNREPLSFIIYNNRADQLSAETSESGTTNERIEMANALDQKATEVHPSFFVMLGDNFNGNDGSTVINNPASHISTEVPRFPVLGNQHYYALPFDNLLNQKLLDNFYTKIFNVPNSDKTLQIFFVDTVILAPNAAGAANNVGNPDGYISKVQMLQLQPYLNLLENQLRMSTAEYKMVAGQYHVYTVTDGDDSIPELERFLVPLMKKYGVLAYINGNKRNTEHFFLDGIHYITVGNGCGKDQIAAEPWIQVGAHMGKIVGSKDEGVRYAQGVSSFGVMEVTDSSMVLHLFDEDLNHIYNTTITTPLR